MIVTCSECKKTGVRQPWGTIRKTMEEIRAELRAGGWNVQHGRAICPACVAIRFKKRQTFLQVAETLTKHEKEK